jgi:hypothetical protein
MRETEKCCLFRLRIHHAIYVTNGSTNDVMGNFLDIKRLTPTKQWQKMNRNLKDDHKNLTEIHLQNQDEWNTKIAL